MFSRSVDIENSGAFALSLGLSKGSRCARPSNSIMYGLINYNCYDVLVSMDKGGPHIWGNPVKSVINLAGYSLCENAT